MKSAITLAVCAFGLALWHQPARAQGQFDGQWTGKYECGPHANKPLPAFSWPVSIDIKDGAISGQYAYQVRLANGAKTPATVSFSGAIDGTGDATVTAIARKSDQTEDFHQTLIRSIATATEIKLAGPMLGQGEIRLRECTLALTLNVPDQQNVAASPLPTSAPPAPVPAPRPSLEPAAPPPKQQNMSIFLVNHSGQYIVGIRAKESSAGQWFNPHEQRLSAGAYGGINLGSHSVDWDECHFDFSILFMSQQSMAVQGVDVCDPSSPTVELINENGQLAYQIMSKKRPQNAVAQEPSKPVSFVVQNHTNKILVEISITRARADYEWDETKIDLAPNRQLTITSSNPADRCQRNMKILLDPGAVLPIGQVNLCSLASVDVNDTSNGTVVAIADPQPRNLLFPALASVTSHSAPPTDAPTTPPVTAACVIARHQAGQQCERNYPDLPCPSCEAQCFDRAMRAAGCWQ